jgi:hypothetical protein
LVLKGVQRYYYNLKFQRLIHNILLNTFRVLRKPISGFENELAKVSKKRIQKTGTLLKIKELPEMASKTILTIAVRVYPFSGVYIITNLY